MTSRISTARESTIGAVAQRTPGQLAMQRRLESLIRVAAPALDVVLFVGDRISRVAGRNQIDPEPPRRIANRETRPTLAGPPDRAV
jgi:hypothetical protein